MRGLFAGWRVSSSAVTTAEFSNSIFPSEPNLQASASEQALSLFVQAIQIYACGCSRVAVIDQSVSQASQRAASFRIARMGALLDHAIDEPKAAMMQVRLKGLQGVVSSGQI